MPTPAPTAGPAPDLDDPDPEGSPELTRRRRVLLVAGLLLVALTAGPWLYAIFFYDPGRMIDELADRTFPTGAEKVCAEARDRIADLPPADRTPDPVDRADTIDRANDHLRAMTAALEPLVPVGQGRVTAGIREWIADWNTYIGDRQEYADSLRRDPATRFAESRKGRRQVSLAIDAFAKVNRMDSCAVPGDVG